MERLTAKRLKRTHKSKCCGLFGKMEFNVLKFIVKSGF